jgi:hypothetical protein
VSASDNVSPWPSQIPAGSLIAVAPPATGKSSLLVAQLVAAGLPPERTLARDEVRAALGDNFDQGAPSIPPPARGAFETVVTAQIDEIAAAYLASGQTWFYDQTGCNGICLGEEVVRAHAHDLAAVALRRRGNDGSPDVTLEFALANDAARRRHVPVEVITFLHARYAALSVAVLYDLGFDLVLEWDQCSVLPPVQVARLDQA